LKAVVLFCSILFWESCTKIENVESFTPDKAEKSSQNAIKFIENPSLRLNPVGILEKTKLTAIDLSVIENKLRKVDINSFHSKTYPEFITIYSAKIIPIQNGNSTVSNIMIIDKAVNNHNILTYYIGSVENFDKNISASNPRKVINGKTSLYNFNTAVLIESIIRNGFDKGATISPSLFQLQNRDLLGGDPFSKCFADGVFSFVEHMSWLERALCIIDIELCLPGVTIGCRIKCA
jgi:hypothetical protein